jgi:Flp pilus assembly protein TadD
VYHYLGRALLVKDRPKEAAAYLTQAVQHMPADAASRNALAVALVALREYPQAIAQLEQAQRLAPRDRRIEANLTCLRNGGKNCVLQP